VIGGERGWGWGKKEEKGGGGRGEGGGKKGRGKRWVKEGWWEGGSRLEGMWMVDRTNRPSGQGGTRLESGEKPDENLGIGPWELNNTRTRKVTRMSLNTGAK